MNIITEKVIASYTAWLIAEERACSTCIKYTHYVRGFADCVKGAHVTKDAAIKYKALLSETRKAPSVNAAVAALNSFFSYMGWGIKLKPIKIQRKTFRTEVEEFTREEYERLLRAAQAKGDIRIRLIIETLCSTGIRVSELCFMTVTAAQRGQALITNKGKARLVFIPKSLQVSLLRYANERKIDTGCIFITSTKKPIDRRDIWLSMKALCKVANVKEEKVYPHNLRHLFAREFYNRHKDVVKLADVLGHSSLNTTRIYTMESGAEHRKLVDELELVAVC